MSWYLKVITCQFLIYNVPWLIVGTFLLSMYDCWLACSSHKDDTENPISQPGFSPDSLPATQPSQFTQPWDYPTVCWIAHSGTWAPLTSTWPHLRCDVCLEKGEHRENCLCLAVLCTIIMVHKDTSSSYRSVDCIGL